MDLRIRPIVEDEFEDFRRCDAVAFGFEPKAEDAERLRAGLELDRTAAAFDGEQLVGASAALTCPPVVRLGRQHGCADPEHTGVGRTGCHAGTMTVPGPYPFKGEVIWLTPEQGGRRTGPPCNH